MNTYRYAEGPFEPSWESLRRYEVPEWFRDAKFGIWAHWGPQSVPKAGDWYARNMYIEGHRQYSHHLEHYGHPCEVGYKDIVRLWRAERFQPEELIRLYKDAGARYFTAMAVHHDNFDCWDSVHHSWNSVKVGPGKDIVALWREAALRHGLRFGVTEHLERSYSWFNTNKGHDTKGPRTGMPYDGNDPRYEDFYFPPHGDTDRRYPADPPEWWQRRWFDRIKDVVDRYDPDLLYTDGAIPFGEVGRTLVAHFYNRNVARRGGRLEAVYALKKPRDDRHGEYMEGVGVRDVERGVVDDIYPQPWQTDTCVGGWYYDRDRQYKTAQTVIHMLADIASKNGNLLLNFPLRPDGTLDERELDILSEIRDWMRVNGEALCGSRPWQVFGEGPTRLEAGHMSEREEKLFTAEDFRFWTKGGVLHAVCMGWPEVEWRIGSLAGLKVRAVDMLGSQEPVRWSAGAGGLSVRPPSIRPCRHAWTLRIEVS